MNDKGALDDSEIDFSNTYTFNMDKFLKILIWNEDKDEDEHEHESEHET